MAVGPGFHVDAQGNLHIGSTRETFDSTTLSEAPFSVTKAGVLKATSGSFTGDISGASGTFTGNLSGSTITGGSINIGSGTFQVDSSGNLTATSASISGVISAGGAAADINNNSTQIDGGKIVANSVTVAEANISGQLSFGKLSISSQNIIDTLVDNAILDTIGNGQISDAKLGSISADKISGGSIDAGILTGDAAIANLSTSNAISIGGSGQTSVFLGTVQGTGGLATGSTVTHTGGTSKITFASSYVDLAASGTSKFRATTVQNTSYDDLRPGSNDAYDLGASYAEWRDIYAGNTTIQTSDINLKTDVEDITLGLDFVNTLEPIEFKWTDGGVRTHLGFSAQDVKQKLIDAKGDSQNYAVYTQGSYETQYEENEDGDLVEVSEPVEKYGLRTGELIPILVKSIQELTARIEELEA